MIIQHNENNNVTIQKLDLGKKTNDLNYIQ